MSDYDYGLHALDQAFVTRAHADRQAAEQAHYGPVIRPSEML
jgi:hypothetical protein